MDQNGSNLIKFRFLTYQKILLYKVITFIIRINMVNFFGSDQIKSVQNGSKRIKFGFLTFIMRMNMVNIFGSDEIKVVKLD